MAREYMVIKSECFFSLTTRIHQCLSVQALFNSVLPGTVPRPSVGSLSALPLSYTASLHLSLAVC